MVNRSRKLLFLIVFLVVFPAASFAAQKTSDAAGLQLLVGQLQEQIKQLQGQIAELQTQLQGAEQKIEEVKTELKFTKALQRGATGDEVKKLQEFLKSYPDIYPEGLITGYFGLLTETAVKKLQKREGIEVIGSVGPKTLAKINALLSEEAGNSGAAASGLLTAPGIQKKIDTFETAISSATTTGTSLAATTTPIISTDQTTPAAVNASSTKASSVSPVAIIASALTEKPWDVVMSGSDYIVTTVDLGKNTGHLLRIKPDGTVSTIASAKRRFSSVTVRSSDFYVTDGDTNILKISSDGTISTLMFLSNAGIGTGAHFQNDIVASSSDFIITDYDGGRLLRVNSVNAVTIASGLRNINNVIADGPDFIVLAANNNGQSYLYRVTETGTVSPFASLENLGSASGLTKIDSYFYVGLNNSIARVSSSGMVSVLPISISGQLINLTNDGSELIATDYTNSRLLRITLSSPTSVTTVTPPMTPPAMPVTQTTINAAAAVTATSTSASMHPSTPDATAPSTPTGLSATAASSALINLLWTASTDNVGVTGYKLYRGGTQIATVTSGTAYTDSGLAAQTTYSYAVGAYDASGNVSAQSILVSVTTPVTAPTGGNDMGASFTTSGDTWQPGVYAQLVRFGYDAGSITQVKSFRLYQKKSGDANFNLVETISDPVPSCDASGIKNGAVWKLTYLCSSPANLWEMAMITRQPASYFSVGDYEFYITAVNSSGVESPPSPTFKTIVLAPTETLSPAESQSPVSSKPTLQWTTGGNFVDIYLYEDKYLTDPSTPIVYVKRVYGTAPFIYDGPTLDPAKKYALNIQGQNFTTYTYTSSGYNATISMTKKIEKFWISTSTISSFDLRANQLAAISQAMDGIKELFSKLLREHSQ